MSVRHFQTGAGGLEEARRALAKGHVKESIRQAGRSVENVMQDLTGNKSAGPGQLIRSLLAQHYFDDLPDHVRSEFAVRVLETPPFLTNQLAGEGEEEAVDGLSPVYGEFVLQLADALHTFLIAKHLEQAAPASSFPDPGLRDDDIPF